MSAVDFLLVCVGIAVLWVSGVLPVILAVLAAVFGGLLLGFAELLEWFLTTLRKTRKHNGR